MFEMPLRFSNILTAMENEITSVPARLVDTKLMKVYLVVNVNPNRPPNEFELESFVQLRNLKAE